MTEQSPVVYPLTHVTDRMVLWVRQSDQPKNAASKVRKQYLAHGTYQDWVQNVLLG